MIGFLRCSKLVFAAVAVLLVLPSSVSSYSGTCHARLTEEAALIFGFPELEDYLNEIAEGAKCEDNIEHIYDDEGPCGATVRHFWDADDSDNFQQNNCLGYDYNNAWVKGRRLVDRANQYFASYIQTGNHADLMITYHYLGHVCHMLGDMGVPAHVHIDYHPNDPLDDDCYEDWFAAHDFPNDPALCLNWDHEDAVNKWSDLRVWTDDAMQIRNYLGNDCWQPWQLQASFYYLAYTTNQIADYFASDSYDGDTDDRLGLVTFGGFPSAPTVSDDLDDNDDDPDNDAHGHLSTIANYCYTRSMSATAAWYRVWRDYWDQHEPTTTLDINGAEEVHDGWRPGDVYVGMIGSDDSGGASLYDSGLHEVQWMKTGDVWHSMPGDVGITSITDEGISVLVYRSMDRFANLELIKDATFKVDKTLPEVAIISPEPDGHYLSSGSITIDFEASDVPSGLYMPGFIAEMDGQPVTDGQVFNDLTHMAGFHTVTVTAEDFAGNVTSKSVTFSIKIDATVEISPEPINTKSMAMAMKARIGFPPEYSVALIDVTTVTLKVDGQEFPAKLSPATIGGYGPDDLPTLLLEFERRDVCAALDDFSGQVDMIVEGELTDPIEFYGVDNVEVFTPPRGKSNAPAHLVVEGVSPNPVAHEALIAFGMPSDGRVKIELFDVYGRLVTKVAERDYPAGYHKLKWKVDGSFASGVYFLRMNLGSETVAMKTVISK